MLSHQSRLVLDTLLPSQAHPDRSLGLMDSGFDSFWSDFDRTALPALRWTFRAALFTAIWVAPLLIGRLPPLGRHDRPVREQALAALGSSSLPVLRQMLLILKTVAGFCYGADPIVRQAIGYPGPSVAPADKVVP
jgi:hypothetical protein